MSSFAHFVDFVVKDPDEVPHVIGLLVKAVHSWIRYEFGSDDVDGVRQAKVAIALPSARLPVGTESRTPHPGDVLRVFAVEAGFLNKLLRYPTLLSLRDLDAIAIMPVTPIQSSRIDGYQRWRRSRKPERRTAGFLAREQRRDKRRHRTINTARHERQDLEPYLFLRTTSTETQKRFSLFVTVHEGDPSCELPGVFNSYGLIVGDGGSGVPVLRADMV